MTEAQEERLLQDVAVIKSKITNGVFVQKTDCLQNIAGLTKVITEQKEFEASRDSISISMLLRDAVKLLVAAVIGGSLVHFLGG